MTESTEHKPDSIYAHLKDSLIERGFNEKEARAVLVVLSHDIKDNLLQSEPKMGINSACDQVSELMQASWNAEATVLSIDALTQGMLRDQILGSATKWMDTDSDAQLHPPALLRAFRESSDALCERTEVNTDHYSPESNYMQLRARLMHAGFGEQAADEIMTKQMRNFLEMMQEDYAHLNPALAEAGTVVALQENWNRMKPMAQNMLWEGAMKQALEWMDEYALAPHPVRPALENELAGAWRHRFEQLPTLTPQS